MNVSALKVSVLEGKEPYTYSVNLEAPNDPLTNGPCKCSCDSRKSITSEYKTSSRSIKPIANWQRTSQHDSNMTRSFSGSRAYDNQLCWRLDFEGFV